jgi:1-acyl-sn-glycerol-3-phosphate acyltransferase
VTIVSNTQQPTYSDLTMRAFEFFFSRWRARRLHIRPLGFPPQPPDAAPLLLIANHTSWWDGFLLRDVQRALRAGCPLYSVMTAQELRRNPFLRRIGAVPIEQGSAGSMLGLLRTLQRAAHEQPGMTVSFFPQGRILPAWQRPLGFRRGVELLVRALQPCWILPVGIHVEPLNRTSPTAFVATGSILRGDATLRAHDLEDAVREQLDRIAAGLLHPVPAPRQTA